MWITHFRKIKVFLFEKSLRAAKKTDNRAQKLSTGHVDNSGYAMSTCREELCTEYFVFGPKGRPLGLHRGV